MNQHPLPNERPSNLPPLHYGKIHGQPRGQLLATDILAGKCPNRNRELSNQHNRQNTSGDMLTFCTDFGSKLTLLLVARRCVNSYWQLLAIVLALGESLDILELSNSPCKELKCSM